MPMNVCVCAHACVTQWRYCIRLENLGEDTVQLRERHWRIFSLSGTLETVRGRGIIGKVSVTTHECWFGCLATRLSSRPIPNYSHMKIVDIDVEFF